MRGKQINVQRIGERERKRERKKREGERDERGNKQT